MYIQNVPVKIQIQMTVINEFISFIVCPDFLFEILVFSVNIFGYLDVKWLQIKMFPEVNYTWVKCKEIDLIMKTPIEMEETQNQFTDIAMIALKVSKNMGKTDSEVMYFCNKLTCTSPRWPVGSTTEFTSVAVNNLIGKVKILCN